MGKGQAPRSGGKGRRRRGLHALHRRIPETPFPARDPPHHVQLSCRHLRQVAGKKIQLHPALPLRFPRQYRRRTRFRLHAPRPCGRTSCRNPARRHVAQAYRTVVASSFCRHARRSPAPDRDRAAAAAGHMKAKARPRFDIDVLRDLAGDKGFARGEAYCRGGQVQILVLEPGRVLAQVAGTEDYRTELTGRDKEIDGACSCPAFEDWGFCKHMVAAALAANAAGSDTAAESALPRIRDHLKKKGVDALVEMIVNLAERDPALFHKLDMAAAAFHGDDKTLEARLSKAIDGATRTKGFV